MPSPLSIDFLLPFAEAIAAAKARGIKLPDDYYHKLPMEKRREAFTVSGLASLDQVQAVLDKLTAKLETGGTMAEFQRWATSQDWGIPKHRLETIYRNAVQTAYNAGHWRNFEEHKGSRPYLMYDAINDGRTRPAHRALDGIIRPVGDAFWSTHSPMCGHRCRCSLLSMTESQALDRSRPDKDGRATGINKPVTPEMKADDEGWGRKPTEWGETLDKVASDKLRRSSPRMESALKSVKPEDLPILKMKGAAELDQEIGLIAKKRPEWFKDGYQTTLVVDGGKSLFAATEGGKIYLSGTDAIISGFSPAQDLLAAIRNAKSGKPLSFNHEYAVETLWHEITHARMEKLPQKMAMHHLKLLEASVQAYARMSYGELLPFFGATATHQVKIIAEGDGYASETANIIALTRFGLNAKDIESALLSESWRESLVALVATSLNVKQSIASNLLNSAMIKQPYDFLQKLTHAIELGQP